MRRLQQLDEQLFLRGEVPVEDALADAEMLNDVGDRCRVVTAFGEQRGRGRDELLAPVTASLRQLPPHRRCNLLDSVVKETGRKGIVETYETTRSFGRCGHFIVSIRS